MRTLLASAIELHRSGDLRSAAEVYEQVLAADAGNADALHLLGVLHHQQGEHRRAIEEIGRAVSLRPGVPAFHANLAEAYRAAGECGRAAGCCRTALQLWPEYPEALCNLGLALRGLSQHAEAAEAFRGALRLRPDFALAAGNLGITLQELGRPDDALECFRRAAELDPNSHTARTNLGQMLVDLGRAEEGLPHCREAVRLQPDLPALHHNLGNALLALGRSRDARAAFLEAIRLDPGQAESHAQLGSALRRDGQLADALVWLKQATELKPDDATFWENLADLHCEREASAEAIPCWERVLALDPKRATARHGMGWALQEEGRHAEALEHYREAVALQPEYAAARVSLGGLHEEMGEFAEAEAEFREALRLQPAFALPRARLAMLLRGKLPAADLAALEERLTEPLGDPVRTRLLFGLAHVLDARGEFARAADVLRQANALASEQHRARRQEYSPADHERFVDALIDRFGPAFFARTAGAGSDSRRPVFVFGLPRSGTTLIEQVLSSHSRAHGAGELRAARQSFEAIPRAVGRAESPLDCVESLDADAIRRLAESHDERLRALGGHRDAERVVDKMPDNYLYLGLLAAMFPRAAFVHCRRDPRDVAVSCWMTDFRSIRWANEAGHIATRFRQYRGLMDHWRGVLPVPVHEVAYEEVVSDLEGAARRLLEACGLEWEPACLDFHRTRRVVRTASVTQVREPVYIHSVGRWKNYERELADLFTLLPSD